MIIDHKYKKHLIVYAPHPKLNGKYEIYNSCNGFIGRADTLKSSKQIIKNKSNN